ncbi:hypothetical protein VTK26DRAFT_3435 [Humicola hyalothermophila]
MPRGRSGSCRVSHKTISALDIAFLSSPKEHQRQETGDLKDRPSSVPFHGISGHEYGTHPDTTRFFGAPSTASHRGPLSGPAWPLSHQV